MRIITCIADQKHREKNRGEIDAKALESALQGRLPCRVRKRRGLPNETGAATNFLRLGYTLCGEVLTRPVPEPANRAGERWPGCHRGVLPARDVDQHADGLVRPNRQRCWRVTIRREYALRAT